jgi:genome maintenance exonuclease 1
LKASALERLVTERKTFNQLALPELPKLERYEESGLRFYKKPDGRSYPSVTTVVGDAGKKTIMEWRKRVGEEEANRISAKATRRGTKVHTLCEYYIKNELHKLEERTNEPDVHTFCSIKPIIDKYIDDVVCQETFLYSDYLEVAGTVDCVANFNGVRSIIDFKTSRKAKRKDWIKNYFMQTSAYAVMYEERTGVPISRLVVLIAVDDDHPQIFVEKRDDHIMDFMQVRVDFKRKYNK